MRVAHLSLTDFRNYHVAEVPLRPGLNLLLGRNGQGKTNLVEAISYFDSLGSHRVSNESALIRSGANAAIARMKVSVEDREVLLEMQLNRDKPNRAQVNRNPVRPREVTRWFSSVLFAPEDLTLVKGDPATRRRFLDDSVISRNPVFAKVVSEYEKVVKQRSALLKSARAGSNRSALDSTLDIWDSQLIELGTSIMLARRSLVSALEEPFRAAYDTIVQHDHFPHISLTESVPTVLEKQRVSRETFEKASLSDAELPENSTLIQRAPIGTHQLDGVSRETLAREFRNALTKVRRQEFDRGTTLIGPHRDDALFELNHLPVKGYASHGESWSFALALRLGIATLLRDELPSGDPVIILDDVFAELDLRRREALMTAVSHFEQVIVTAAVEEDLPDANWHRIHIQSGTLVSIGHDDG